MQRAIAGDLEAAFADDTAGLKFAAGDLDTESQLQCNRGLHYLALGDTEESLKDLSAVIIRGTSDNETLGIAYCQRAASRFELGQIEAAVSDCEAALKLTGTNIDTRFECRRILCSISENSEDFEIGFRHACAMCEIEGLPHSQATVGIFVRGVFALQLGKSEQAVWDLSTAREMATQSNLVELIKLIDEVTPRVSDAGDDKISR